MDHSKAHIHSSRIALGTVQFGMNYGISNESGQTPLEKVKQLIKTAASNGITTLDTAIAYGNSESVLGECDIKNWDIITKFQVSEGGRKDLKSLFQESLQRLHKASIYGFISHNASTLLKNPGIWDELQTLKLNGKVKKIGFSLYTPAELEELLKLDFFPDLIQVPFNFIDQRFVPYFSELKSKGAEIHTRSVFLQGLFFMDPELLAPFFRPVKTLLQELNLHFNTLPKKTAFLLQFCLHNSYVDKVVIGVNNIRQLEDNIGALNLGIEDAFLIPEMGVNTINEHILLPYNWPLN